MDKLDKILDAFIEQKDYKKDLNSLSNNELCKFINQLHEFSLPYKVISKHKELIIIYIK